LTNHPTACLLTRERMTLSLSICQYAKRSAGLTMSTWHRVLRPLAIVGVNY
jgi:hypothetical protein